MKFHEEILSDRQRRALQSLAPVATAHKFYLAGGTAVALYLGHRRSADFDWFTSASLGDPLVLGRALRDAGIAFRIEQIARGTLHGRIAGVRLSFFSFPYQALRGAPLWRQYGCRVASLDDLAAMKLSAIAQRGSKKDFVDLYALWRRHPPLDRLLKCYQKKFGIADAFHLVASLTFFDDADRERMPSLIWKVQWTTIKKALQQWARTRQ